MIFTRAVFKALVNSTACLQHNKICPTIEMYINMYVLCDFLIFSGVELYITYCSTIKDCKFDAQKIEESFY
eukprot:UN02354